MTEISTKKKIELITEAALSKKARDCLLVDLRKLPSLCDYFIIASGDSTTQIGSIAENIEKALSKHNCRLWHKEGRPESLWVILDFCEIIVHIFYHETRSFYNLEKIWHDAPQKKLKERRKKKSRRKLKTNEV